MIIKILLPFIIAVLTIGFILSRRPISNQSNFNDQINITKTVPTIMPTSDNDKVVPLPSEEDIIRTFFNLINEEKILDAIKMMDPVFAGDDTSRQSWGVHFFSISSIKVKSIEPSMKEDWDNNSHIYKVILTVSMKPEATKAPIPNYGWEKGDNIRFISLIKNGDRWLVTGIATGP